MEQQEDCAVNVLKQNLKVKDKSDMEMFSLSGTDSDSGMEMIALSATVSDSDMEVPQVKKKKIDNSKALVISFP